MKYESDLSFEKIRRKSSDPDRESGATVRRKRFREDDGEFRCRSCKGLIGPPPSGTRQRNHCPRCLASLHLDERPGDRAAQCGSLMEPIAIWVRSDEWVLLHRCKGCGVIHANRIAPDDNETLLLSLAARPLGRPAFPLYVAEEDD